MDSAWMDPDADIIIRRLQADGERVILEGEGGADGAACPDCGAWSTHVHGRYRRRIWELPWSGRPVRLVLIVRNFRCLNPGCPRRTFAEAFEPLVGRRQQRTAPVKELLLDYVRAAGGERGAKLARRAGIPTSPDTLLRLQREQVLPVRPTPRVLGVDDLALRRGRRYATLLLDLETREPVDLLLGRSATDLADWLRQHEGVEVVVRDRGGEYAEGARRGAPLARQVADKFHLLANATNAMDETLRGRPLALAGPGGPDGAADLGGGAAARANALDTGSVPAESVASDDGTIASAAPPPASSPATRVPVPSARAARWRERWERARALRADGRHISQIARDLGLSRPTIRKLLTQTSPPWQDRPGDAGPLIASALRPFLPYLQRRWAEGAGMGALLRELRAQGYRGSWSTLWRALHTWPRPEPIGGDFPAKAPTATALSRRDRRWLLLRSPDQVTVAEQAVLGQLLAADPAVAMAHGLLGRFRAVFKGGSPSDLDGWLAEAERSGLPAFASLAHGIRADREAVDGALTTKWSAGPTEGRICKIKLQKRLGYGRATFELLRQRVLAA